MATFESKILNDAANILASHYLGHYDQIYRDFHMTLGPTHILNADLQQKMVNCIAETKWEWMLAFQFTDKSVVWVPPPVGNKQQAFGKDDDDEKSKEEPDDEKSKDVPKDQAGDDKSSQKNQESADESVDKKSNLVEKKDWRGTPV